MYGWLGDLSPLLLAPTTVLNSNVVVARFQNKISPNFKIILLKRSKQLFSKLLWPFPKNEQTDLDIRVIFVEDLKRCQQNLDFILCSYPISKQQKPRCTYVYSRRAQSHYKSSLASFLHDPGISTLENNVVRANGKLIFYLFFFSVVYQIECSHYEFLR